ncbi:aminoglycoside 3-N-acetyltransferase [Pelagibacterium xiamenense]|uniref:aminoglycoside 3-N-acetyltransferase n=1 Tax=Pelagibacterium xiamenense TaxID=2901140 RepID=UPI001E6128C1|nr:aminoglycoside 3-N-acetyltransferase [Pelagibacterium xiamenense]MCD7059460.1 aminoglycoside 3-N-acetyltransferase [Pelagibacterium xiamenense]
MTNETTRPDATVEAPRAPFVTRAALLEDLRAIGLARGDIVMVHAALSKIGPLLNGPDAVIGALRDAVGPEGTVMGYTDWDARYEDLLDADGRVPDAWKPHIPPFDPLRSRAIRDNGAFPEFLRTTPGALRSGSPGASMAAIGARAEWLTAGHPIDYGYGARSPLAKLVEAGGKVLMLGAPRDTMTLIHHAEHLARLEGKRIKRIEVPFASETGTVWRWVEEFNTGEAVIPALDDIDYFTDIVTDFLESGSGRSAKIGHADSILVDAAAMTRFAVDWLERRYG